MSCVDFDGSVVGWKFALGEILTWRSIDLGVTKDFIQWRFLA